MVAEIQDLVCMVTLTQEISHFSLQAKNKITEHIQEIHRC